MKKIIKDEDLELMSYDDVAYEVLKSFGKKMKIKDLFYQVVKMLKLTDEEYEKHIGDFFELLSTDKRFIMLENGFWDLRVNHSHKIKIEEDEDDFADEVELEDEESEDDNIHDDIDSDDDEVDDDLGDLSVVSEDDEESDSML